MTVFDKTFGVSTDDRLDYISVRDGAIDEESMKVVKTEDGDDIWEYGETLNISDVVLKPDAVAHIFELRPVSARERAQSQSQSLPAAPGQEPYDWYYELCRIAITSIRTTDSKPDETLFKQNPERGKYLNGDTLENLPEEVVRELALRILYISKPGSDFPKKLKPS